MAQPPKLPSINVSGVTPPRLPISKGAIQSSPKRPPAMPNQSSQYERQARVPQQRRQTQEEMEEGSGNEQAVPQKVKYRINIIVGAALVIIGLYLDILEALLDAIGTAAAGIGVLFGYVKDLITVVAIPLVFIILRAPFWKGRKAGKKISAYVVSSLISFVPWIGAIMPETAIGIFATVYLTRAEDREKMGASTHLDSIVRAKRVRSKINRVDNP